MPPKRSHDRRSESNGRKKWLKTTFSDGKHNPSKLPPGTVVFRVLCPASKSGGLIGKGGGVVTKIRKETGAKIKIEEPITGCDERVVVITGLDKQSGKDNAEKKDNDEVVDNDEVKDYDETEDDNVNGDEGENPEEDDENAEEEKVSQSSQLVNLMSSAQKALLLIFEKIAESDIVSEDEDEDEENKESSNVTIRMLVESTQVGCLLGKGGSVIKQMAAESGAQIRILPKDKLPLCTSEFNELVQITGQLDEARMALHAVSQQILDNPPREHDQFLAKKIYGQSPNLFNPFPYPEVHRGEIRPPANFHLPDPPHFSRFHEPDLFRPSFPRFPEGNVQIPPEPFTYRFICVNDKVGGLIGKGGSIVKKLQHETGCEIKVLEPSPESEDRVVTITGPVLPDNRFSPPQDCVLRVMDRIAMPAPDVKENAISFRVIVSSNQTGCLLGKGGSIITEMRRSTGAHIRILAKELIPNFVSENGDELVQVTGDPETVQEALIQITSRLKNHLFRDRFPGLDNPGNPPFLEHLPPFRPFMGRREPSPPGMIPQMGLSFRKFDSVGGFNLCNDRDFAHGFPPSGGERLPPPPWRAPGLGDTGPMTMHDYPGGPPHRRMSGFPSGNQQNFITNTTVDVVVPQSVVASIYGEDGYALKQIRQISGADININDPRPGATETVIVISGTPDQTHAAQSLIQAFVLSESGSP